jgi:hypothetical protein
MARGKVKSIWTMALRILPNKPSAERQAALADRIPRSGLDWLDWLELRSV